MQIIFVLSWGLERTPVWREELKDEEAQRQAERRAAAVFHNRRVRNRFFASIACGGVVAYSQTMELLTAAEIVRLSPPERIALIAQLQDSLDGNQLPLTAAQSAELDNRLASFDQDRQNGVTWTALKAELEQRCP